MSSAQLSLDSYVPLGVLSASTLSPYPADSDDWSEFYSADFAGWHDKISHTSHRIRLSPETLGPLLDARWIRVFHGRNRSTPAQVCFRVYVLPEDVGRRDIPRTSTRLRNLLAQIINGDLDKSPEAWGGYEACGQAVSGDLSIPSFAGSRKAGGESLFYIFNTISSPEPDPSLIDDAWSVDAAAQILRGRERDLGVMTKLYPYQRRSIASMIQKEVSPQFSLDPRVEERVGPTGQRFFCDRVTTQVYINGAHYEEPRGGILAETMGYGKTLIVLALIAASKDQMPKTPVEHTETRPFTNKIGARSLQSTAANFAIKHGLPWRQYFRDLANQGMHFDRCLNILETPAYYEIVSTDVLRSSRQPRPPRKILLCKTSLIIVPTNLFDQWKTEIRKHIAPDALNILEVQNDHPMLGTAEELSKYDLILIEKRRYLLEMRFSQPPADKIDQYNYAFTNMHFLRVVIDEGHTFASTGAVSSEMNPITALLAERRWIVSGTPSRGLVGVEVDLAANTGEEVNELGSGISATRAIELQNEILQKRKQVRNDDISDLKKLGRIVTELLCVQPWCNTSRTGDQASWATYTKLNAGNGFVAAASVRSILQSLVVRHQIGDVEAELPPLTNKPVYLEPTLYDRASLDLFTFVLMNNAVTSEREDQDYLFHDRNRKFLDGLIRNLRRAPFFWSGFSIDEINKSLEVAVKYSAEHTELNGEDKLALDEALQIVPRILGDTVWQVMSSSQEIALCVSGLPQTISAPLGIDRHSISLIDSFAPLAWTAEQLSTTTASRLLTAQKFCRDKGALYDPIRELQYVVDKIANTSENSDRVLSGANEKEDSKGKPKGLPQFGDKQLNDKQFARHKSTGSLASANPKKRKLSNINKQPEEPLIDAADIRVTGTVSAKLSYLLGRVQEFYKDEKILIFYEGDSIAWYIAQGLEVLGIPHFIYANKIGSRLRNKYHETFMQDTCEERVMLIDIRQGGQGLNITSASRIFFVNPVWHVGTEAQAIKRAHRIGQTRPVHVETLILKDSIEHKIFERRRHMTSVEQARAGGNPLDDNQVHELLKRFTFYGSYEHMSDDKRYAPLRPKPLVFPELAESQQRDKFQGISAAGHAASSTAAAVHFADENSTLKNAESKVPAARLDKKVKKVVGFA